MNTTILVAAEGSREDLEPGFDRVRRFVAESEERFSRFRETSELTALNRSVGQWFEASGALFSLLQEAVDAFHLTSGLFDPTILGALKAAGYDRSMDEIRRVASLPGPLDFPAPSLDFDSVILDPARHALWMPEGMQIDLGGIAKGWIARARPGSWLNSPMQARSVRAVTWCFLVSRKENRPGKYRWKTRAIRPGFWRW